MTIKRINEFPSASGVNLTPDDVFLFMDDPAGSAETKKVSLATLSSFLGGGGGGGNADTGDISFDGIKIIGYGNASGDGNEYSTIELVPDSGLYNNHQYLIVDPTTPNHIHLRAGGAQDNSNAELIVGGEKTHLSVRDSDQRVRLETENIVTIISYYFNTSSGFSSAVWETVDNTNRIVINNPNSDVYSAVTSFNSPSVFSVVDNVNNPILTITGSQTPGDPSPIILTVEEAPPSNPTNLDQLVFEINQNRNSYISVNGSDVRIEAADDVRIYSNDVFRLYNNSSSDPIEIITNYNSNDEQYWRFNSDGKLTLPNGNLIESQAGQGETNIQIIDNDSPFKIYTHASVGAKAWIYDADGNLSIPGSISLPNNSTIASGTFDNGTGGNGGISLNCVVGYELNWQGGRLKSTYNNGESAAPIFVDSPMSAPPVVLESASNSNTINTNAKDGDIFDITLTENSTLANPTNPVNGKTLRWRITQDGTGNRTVTLGNKFNIPSSATSPLPWSTSPNKMDVLAATYHEGRDKWDVIAFVPGY